MFAQETYKNATLFVPRGSVDAYKKVSPWSSFQKIVGEDFSGTDIVTATTEDSETCSVYDLNGVKVGDTTDALTRGIYILHQGKEVKKIIVK